MNARKPYRPSRGANMPCAGVFARLHTAARAGLFVAALFAALVPLASRAATPLRFFANETGSLDDIINGVATGGDFVNFFDNGDGTYDVVHVFTATNGTSSLVIPSSLGGTAARVLVVGGGGSGDGNCGGGGGAGGVIVNNSFTLNAGEYEITVGAGGISTAHSGSDNNGEDTSIAFGGSTVFLAKGGGHGGGWGTAPTAGGSGGGGGAAGGGSRDSTQSSAGVAPSGSIHYGNAGGTANSQRGGGGGGAGAAGANGSSSAGGKGGDGIYCDIIGTDDFGTGFYFAGGGGGAGYVDTSTGLSGGNGGKGGGGKGSSHNGNHAQNGTPGTGGGGAGGAGGGGGSYFGASGGSGVVAVRYTIVSANPFVADRYEALKPEEASGIGGASGGDWVRKITSASDGTVSILHFFENTAEPGYLVVAGGHSIASGSGTVTLSGGGGAEVDETWNFEPGLVYSVNVGAASGSGAKGGDSSIVSGSVTNYFAAGGTGSNPGMALVRYSLEAVRTAPEVVEKSTANVDGGDYILKIDNGDGTWDYAHVWTNTAAAGTFTVGDTVAIIEGSARFLAVGGGGGGGHGTYTYPGAGGGGAGGLVTNSLDLAMGVYQITVGAGGKGSTAGNARGGTGGGSSISNAAVQIAWALGGGGGGSEQSGDRSGSAGGSGGGGVRGDAAGEHLQGGYGYPDGIGNDGGKGASNTWYGGGGGGAGSAGSATGGGGAGIFLDFTGYLAAYAGGGAGTDNASASSSGLVDGSNTPFNPGGSGIGGDAGTRPTAGLDGTGAGGGGGTVANGCAGGNGIVVIRYTVYSADVTPMSDGSTLYAFSNGGSESTWELLKPSLVRVVAVGGGGAGATGLANSTEGGNGGGGAGGFVEIVSNVWQAARYIVNVGLGGKAGGDVTVPTNGGDGEDTTITSTNGTVLVKALGGGGGGARGNAGRPGGSGGGGSTGYEGGAATQPGSAFGGLGNAGGEAWDAAKGAGAGGGGAGGAGGIVISENGYGGGGGAGIESDIAGFTLGYAAGGGGGGYNGGGAAGVGGTGSGGGGGVAAKSGEDGTGSGGGGGGGTSVLTALGGDGGSGVIYIRVLRSMPEAPATTAFAYDYDGAEHEAFTRPVEDDGVYTISNITAGVATNRIAATDAGVYVYKLAIDDGLKALGWCWADGTVDDKTITLTIDKATVTIDAFHQDGWQVGSSAPAPEVAVSPEWVTGYVEYQWTDDTNGSVVVTAEAPTTAGTHYARAVIVETANFIGAASEWVAVELWNYPDDAKARHPDYLGYHADIVVESAALDRLLLVEIAENQPTGFTYDKAAADGSDIRFTCAIWDAVGSTNVITVLGHKWETWNVGGVSRAWVCVPAGIDKVTMNWGLVVDGEGETVAIPDIPDAGEITTPTDDSMYGKRAYHALVTISGAGTEPLTSFPMALEISTNLISRFRYEDAGTNGWTLVFTGNDGSLLPYEVDTWNTNGTSLVWVKVPTYAEGETFNMHWGYLEDVAIPASTETWSAYAGVWHMSDKTGTVTGERANADPKDSSPGNAPGVIGNRTYTTNSIFGTALAAKQTGQPLIRVTDTTSAIDAITNGPFTVSFYTLFHPTGSGSAAQYLFSRRPNDNSPGYAARIAGRVVSESSNTFRILYGTTWGSGGNMTDSKFGMPASQWIRHDVYFNGAVTNGRFEWWINGVCVDGSTWQNSLVSNGTNGWFGIGGAASTLGNTSGQNFNGAMDEFRIASGAPDAARIAAETNMWGRIASGEGVAAFGTTVWAPGEVFDGSYAYNTDGAILQNRWLDEPYVSPEAWNLGYAGVTFSMHSAYGTPYYVFKSVSGAACTNALPAEAGDYLVYFHVDGGSFGTSTTNYYTSLIHRHPGTIVVTKANEGQSSVGGTTTATRSGRVLLFNDETDLGVTDQSYWETNETVSATYWVHGEDDSYDSLWPHASAAITHVLRSTEPVDELFGTNVIWTIDNARIGSLYKERPVAQAGYNYLPHSTTASVKAEDGSGYETDPQAELAQHLILRNVEGAGIISPCYSNGVGTIYFDAVNASKYGDFTYNLAVYATTNMADSAEENWTNGWTRLEMKVFKFNSTTCTDLYPGQTTNTLDLLAAGFAGGQANRFCRVAVPVYRQFGEYRGPVRFCIRRVGVYGTSMNLKQNHILVDNIVVSYPPDGVRLAPPNAEHFDASKTGKEVLGMEYATAKPFPAIGDALTMRTRLDFLMSPMTNVNVAAGYVTSLRTFYRWRYLDQHTNVWSDVAMRLGDIESGKTASTINAVEATPAFPLPGDVEFYYIAYLNAPYYTLYDYSGLGANIPEAYYTENISVVTNRYLNSLAGKEWFVRPREGTSNLAEMHLVVDSGSTTNRYAMEVVGDDTWQGFYSTPTDSVGVVRFAIEMVNRQQEGEDWSSNTNFWKANFNDATSSMPSGSLTLLGEEIGGNWTEVTNTAETGFMLFQVADNSSVAKAISVVRAERQEFNEWNDAKETFFVGYGTPTNVEGKASGTANHKKKYSLNGSGDGAFGYGQNMEFWTPMEDGSDVSDWEMKSPVGSVPMYTKISAADNGGWDISNFKWVYSSYQSSSSPIQPQLRGDSGSIQYGNMADIPRGIGKVEYSARVAQSLESIDDFCWYWGDGGSSTSNYTFVASAKMIQGTVDDFSGDGSVSVVANYQARKGCYEFRVTRTATNSVSIALYKWQKSTATKVAESAGSNPACIASGLLHATSTYAGRLAISVSNATDGVWIMGALLSNAADKYAMADCTESAVQHRMVAYCDKSSPFRKGAYGVGSVNCNAMFVKPRTYDKPISKPNGLNSGNYGNYSIKYDGTANTCISNADGYDDWAWDGNTITPNTISDSYGTHYGFKALVEPQTLYFETKDVGSSSADWVVRATNLVDSLDSSMRSIDLNVPADSILRIRTSGEEASPDLIVVGVKMRQWRGADWNDTADTPYHGNYTGPDNHITNYLSEANPPGNYTNITFHSGWITNVTVKGSKVPAILLSAKRTVPGKPCDIKTPLMFDYYGSYSGTGIGMMSYKYANAQSNTVLLVQIATNVSLNAWTSTKDNGYNTINDMLWTTVATNDFSVLTDEERASGAMSTYFGVHGGAYGVGYAARLLMAPSVVNSVTNQTDSTLFGDIYITDFRCTDEPEIDIRSWWGWNIRSLGGDNDSEGRMYLIDGEKAGLSMALNNSIYCDIDTNTTYETYKAHMPFVQTPELGSAMLGEIRFKARNYVWKGDESVCDTNGTQAAEFNEANGHMTTISLYGAPRGNSGANAWKRLKTWAVSNDVYTTYSYKAGGDNTYKAFRLVATDIKGVADGDLYDGGSATNFTPVRVLIDDVVVAQALRAQMLFKKVGAFRGADSSLHVMDSYLIVTNVPSAAEQPLCGEPWGIQCEIYPSQLSDEIMPNLEDENKRPRVTLHYYVGDSPWGYGMWRDRADAQSFELTLAEDATVTNIVYRSAFPDDTSKRLPVIEERYAPQTVQYTLEVAYMTSTGDETAWTTNYLNLGQWTKPAWFAGIDLNATLGGNTDEGFAAYTILDTVAPGWAWINEANIFGVWDSDYNNLDAKRQFIEIAVPEEADITGWSVRALFATESTVTTNTLVTFDSNDSIGVPGKKVHTENNHNGMAFRTIGPPNCTLSMDDGSLDGKWSASAVSQPLFDGAGTIWEFEPFAIQLVRGSGIVEHEIATIGTNWFGESYTDYSVDTLVNRLRTLTGSEAFNAGDDSSGAMTDSLSVFDEKGESASVWTNMWPMSPGRVNEDGNGKRQYIDPNHPTPNGETIIVTCQLDTSAVGARLWQSIDDADFTNANQQVYLAKGSTNGLRIVYKADPWFELDTVKTGDVSVAFTPLGSRTYEATVGKYASNRFTVVAIPRVNAAIGIEDDRYKDAITDWLVKGEDAYHNKWKNPTNDTIYPVPLFKARVSGGDVTVDRFVTDLDLKTMYWFDLDPTDGPDPSVTTAEVSNVKMFGGFGAAPALTNRTFYGRQYTNTIVTTALWFTNTADAAKAAWSPYILRGADVGETSWNNSTNWTSASFKIAGILVNGRTSVTNAAHWVPLRYFTFNENSFDAGHLSRVEVMDPYSDQSPGWEHWKDWFDMHGGAGSSLIGLFWMVDERINAQEIEELKKENYYE